MEITLVQLLDSRDRRAAYQKKLLSRYPRCLVSFMVNMPGEVKYCDLAVRLHDIGMAAVTTALKDEGYTIFFSEVRPLPTGIEGYLCVSGAPERVKALTLSLEESHPLGRLFDLDVLGPDGAPISRAAMGRGPRKCLLCQEDGAVCARSARHPREALIKKMGEMLDAYGV